jgi:Concanavalin A-like lectin/glucanases superfamily
MRWKILWHQFGAWLQFFVVSLFFVGAISAQQGLTFNGIFHQNVDHGKLWETYSPANPHVLETDFAWEAWVKKSLPPNELGYFISAGYGGAHAILIGFGDGRLLGNFTYMSTGVCLPTTEWVTFASPQVFDNNVWYHVAVASVDHVLTIYKDGQPIFSQTWTGSRISSVCNVLDVSAGILYVGGSNHLNFTGEISQVRGWEGFSPYRGTSFTPETTFSSFWLQNDNSRVESVFLARYKPRVLRIEDLSLGYRSVKHPGYLHPARYMNWKRSMIFEW